MFPCWPSRAWPPGRSPDACYVLFDARADRVYGACYRIRDGGLEVVRPPFAGRLGDVLEGEIPSDVLFCGEGARRHQARIEDAGHRVLPAPAGVPTADGLLHVMTLGGSVERVEEPGRWEPHYLRPWRPGRERKAG